MGLLALAIRLFVCSTTPWSASTAENLLYPVRAALERATVQLADAVVAFNHAAGQQPHSKL